MRRNKRYKRKAKRFIGYCINKKCCDCKYLKYIHKYLEIYEEDSYNQCCCTLKYKYKNEGIREIEKYFKGKLDKPFDTIKDN